MRHAANNSTAKYFHELTIAILSGYRRLGNGLQIREPQNGLQVLGGEVV